MHAFGGTAPPWVRFGADRARSKVSVDEGEDWAVPELERHACGKFRGRGLETSSGTRQPGEHTSSSPREKNRRRRPTVQPASVDGNLGGYCN